MAKKRKETIEEIHRRTTLRKNNPNMESFAPA